MTEKNDFEALLNDTEIMMQIKQSLKDEPVKLINDICKKFEKNGQPVSDYNIHIQGYIGEVSLKALVQSGMLDKVDGGKVSLFSYQPTEIGLKYYKTLKK